MLPVWPRWVARAISSWAFLGVIGLLGRCSGQFERSGLARIFAWIGAIFSRHLTSILVAWFSRVSPRLQAQHAHIRGVQRLLVADGRRPALCAMHPYGSYYGPVDLAFETSRHAAVAENSGDLTPLEPCGLDPCADHWWWVAVSADRWVLVLEVRKYWPGKRRLRRLMTTGVVVGCVLSQYPCRGWREVARTSAEHRTLQRCC